jgi:hypothetical protein
MGETGVMQASPELPLAPFGAIITLALYKLKFIKRSMQTGSNDHDRANKRP